MKKILGIVVLGLLLTNCSSTKVVRNIKINNLTVTESISSNTCKTGTHYNLSLNGEINEDASLVIEKLLSEQLNNKCINKDGKWIVASVYLNSNGGYLSDGFKLGEIFSKYRVSTRIGNDDTCMSSCATAFLGGKWRSMYKGSKLMVHAPYKYVSSQTIECSSNSAALKLKKYYISKIGKKDGEILFDRTMKYCGTSEGWFINKDAARIFNITTP